jgi:hypothetical protein
MAWLQVEVIGVSQRHLGLHHIFEIFRAQRLHGCFGTHGNECRRFNIAMWGMDNTSPFL